MLARLRAQLSYANIMSTLAVFMVLGGGAAVAASVTDSGDIAPQSIKSSDVKKETLKSNRLRDGRAVGDQDVIPDSLTGGAIDESTLNIAEPSSLPPSGPAGGSLTGNYPNPLLAANSVGTAQLQDNGVTEPKIAADSVTAPKIIADAVRASEVGPISIVERSIAVAGGGQGGLDVSCPSGSQVISGGAFFSANTAAHLIMATVEGNGYSASGVNESAGEQALVVRAFCLG